MTRNQILYLGSEYHRNIRVFYNVVTPKNSHRTILSTPTYIRAFSPDGIGYIYDIFYLFLISTSI